MMVLEWILDAGNRLHMHAYVQQIKEWSYYESRSHVRTKSDCTSHHVCNAIAALPWYGSKCRWYRWVSSERQGGPASSAESAIWSSKCRSHGSLAWGGIGSRGWLSSSRFERVQDLACTYIWSADAGQHTQVQNQEVHKPHIWTLFKEPVSLSFRFQGYTQVLSFSGGGWTLWVVDLIASHPRAFQH